MPENRANAEGSTRVLGRTSEKGFSPELNHEVDKTVEWFMDSYAPDKQSFSGFFGTMNMEVSSDDLAYFSTFARISIRQLLISALKSPQGPKFEKARIKALREKTLKGISFNRIIYHEIAHSIIALARSKEKMHTESLRPDYMRHGTVVQTFSQTLKPSLERDEILCTYVYGEVQDVLIEFIKTSKTLEEFVKKLIARSAANLAEFSGRSNKFVKKVSCTRKQDPVFWDICEKVYNNYQDNPKFLFQLFREIVNPLMEKIVPEAI